MNILTKQMITTIKKHLRSSNPKSIIITYGLIFVCFLVAHLNLDYYGDDFVFQNLFIENGLIDTLKIRWNTWSSRLLIESVLLLMTQNFWVWRIFDSLMLTLLVHALTKLTFEKITISRLLLTFLIVHLYPFIDMHSAGWIATTINYIWPLTLMAVSFIYISQLLLATNTHTITPNRWILFLSLIGALFASNSEQVAFITITVSGSFILYMLFNHKKINTYPIFLFLIATLSVFFIKICPGNQARILTDISIYSPNWNELHFYDKLFIAIQVTSSSLLKNTYILSCAIILSVLYCIKNKRFKISSLLIILIYITLIVIRFICNIRGTIIFPIFAYSVDYSNLYSPLIPSILLFILHFLVIFSYPLLILLLLGKKGLLPFFIILVCISSRLLVGFSPTFLASGDRTMIFYYFALLYSILYIAHLLIEHKDLCCR